MKDKEKQIEEMAKILSMNCGECDTCKFLGKTGNRIDCIDFLIANELYEQGYRKIENSVVLSREEYWELKQAKSLLEFREETITLLEDANIRYAEALELKVNEKERKETAEKDFNTIIKALEERKERVKAFYGVAESVGVDIAIRTVKELAKQFGVEIKE